MRASPAKNTQHPLFIEMMQYLFLICNKRQAFFGQGETQFLEGVGANPVQAANFSLTKERQLFQVANTGRCQSALRRSGNPIREGDFQGD